MSNLHKFVSGKNPEEDVDAFVAYCLYKNRKDEEFKAKRKPKEKDMVTNLLLSEQSIKDFKRKAEEILDKYVQILMDDEKERLLKEVLSNLKTNPWNWKNISASQFNNLLSSITIPLILWAIVYLIEHYYSVDIINLIRESLSK